MSDVRDDAEILLDFQRELRAREAAEVARRRQTADKRRLATAQRRARRPAVALPDAAPDGAVERLADRQEKALQRRLALSDRRFTFWPLLGEIPDCGPGEQDVAAVFARKLERVLDHPWSHDERSYLVRLLKKWTLRAAGKDLRFNVVGNRHGALDAESRRRLAIAKTGRD